MKHKSNEEKINLRFQSNNTEQYNAPFHMHELTSSITKAKDSAPGPDHIHYQMLKHLPGTALYTLLAIFNHLWFTGWFPPSWREAIVIPIPKQNKDHANPSNYHLSDSFSQIQGVPQGSILSVTLFAVKINSISNCLKPDTEGTLFVDDFSISYRSKHMLTIERHLQQCLCRLEQWADQNGFTFSSSKTVCMHFCQLRSLHPDPTLTLFKRNIPVVKTFKF
ncbi:reverse transcriptase domain-containing protein, partial [Solemya velum gill symbiont]|uniref:reverse transcriptase domain-containing protein n=1 Tax=Solemya velum gill symbiont TaxID=2340 RepID=UPI001184133A